ncbi:hypothetical protein [Georgenia satyanarayanai]|uniref:hypothetical protein n=1 Tax=Georgenia satyanarayanai TaxID=860221 RepID=UPI001263ECF7|nr:hypothetical protein [Georgenia satyanarayanai]
MITTIAVSVTPVNWQLSYASYVGRMAFLGVALWMLVSVVTMRVSVDRATMLVINGISIVTFQRGDILEVTSHNGVTITTRSGYRCTSGAYGSSNFQGFRPSARYERIASNIRTWASSGDTGRDVVAARHDVGAAHDERRSSRRAVRKPPWRPRPMLTVGLPAFLLVTQLLGLLLWVASEQLYDYLG